jgi:hypothetical protein
VRVDPGWFQKLCSPLLKEDFGSSWSWELRCLWLRKHKNPRLVVPPGSFCCWSYLLVLVSYVLVVWLL